MNSLHDQVVDPKFSDFNQVNTQTLHHSVFTSNSKDRLSDLSHQEYREGMSLKKRKKQSQRSYEMGDLRKPRQIIV